VPVRFDFAGRAALVTGGSSGIGNAIARAFRDAGAAVTVTGTRAAAADYGTDMAGMDYRRLGMADRAGIAALAAGLPALDILVNNAGMAIRGEAGYAPDAFEAVLDVNLNGAWRLAHGVLPLLEASGRDGRGPSVVNIASMTSFFSSPRTLGYGASKAAIVQVTQTLATVWAPAGIRVNAVAPGWIATPLTTGVRANETVNRQIIERTPMARWGLPEEIAGAVLFLASDAAGFVTGTTLPVDGGFSAMGV